MTKSSKFVVFEDVVADLGGEERVLNVGFEFVDFTHLFDIGMDCGLFNEDDGVDLITKSHIAVHRFLKSTDTLSGIKTES